MKAKPVVVIQSVLLVVLIICGGYAFFDSKKRNARARGEINQLNERLSVAKSEFERILAEGEALRKQTEALRKEKEDTVRSLEADRAGHAEKLKLLEMELRKTIETKDVVISQLEGRLKVNVASQILFESGSATLLPEGQSILEKLASAVKTAGNQEIRVEGHTDNVPIGKNLLAQFSTNWELSSSRAISAVRYLVEKCGLPGNRLLAVGCGETRPVSPNDTPENRAHNRRIEIILSPIEN
ncbi:MAG: OmpA family protein [Verrucomicrobiae bacterium]|nr:OmpA family protein [Verrucomicrobiae bacterium]